MVTISKATVSSLSRTPETEGKAVAGGSRSPPDREENLKGVDLVTIAEYGRWTSTECLTKRSRTCRCYWTEDARLVDNVAESRIEHVGPSRTPAWYYLRKAHGADTEVTAHVDEALLHTGALNRGQGWARLGFRSSGQCR